MEQYNPYFYTVPASEMNFVGRQATVNEITEDTRAKPIITT